MRMRFITFLIMVMVFFGCGQSAKHPSLAMTPKPEKTARFAGEFNITPYMDEHLPRTVAVLPFVDETSKAKGADIVRRGFYNHFSSRPFQDMEIIRIDRLLLMEGLADPKKAAQADPKRLGKILGVDAVVFGKVSNFDKLYAVLYSSVSVGAKIQMMDTKTGNLLWEAEHVAKIRRGGISTSPVGIIATIVTTAMNMKDIQLLRACDDLFRDMVDTIPALDEEETLRPPAITLLAQDTRSMPKKAGETIQIVIKGDPGCIAWAAIKGFDKKIPLKEVEPGGYLGSYTVGPVDNVSYAMLTGYLADKSNNTAHWIDPVGTITMDTIPPKTPTGLVAKGWHGEIELKWEKNAEQDLAGYKILKSATPLSGFVEIGETEFSTFTVKGVENFKPGFYKIIAMDKAKNQSSQSGSVKGMAVAPGPTHASGIISKDTIWYAGASPYILDENVIVADNVRLSIEPGTTICSLGPALIIKGSLKAEGTPDSLIIFEGAGSAQWQGVKFKNTGNSPNVLALCRIKNADIGVSCFSASPKISECEITQNKTGIKISGAFSRPDINKCKISKNNAGVLIENSAPILTQNTIFANLDFGIKAFNADQARLENNNIFDNPINVAGPDSGAPIKASDNWWGSANGATILTELAGRVILDSILDGPWPGGDLIEFPVLSGALSGIIAEDNFLLLAKSPYTISKQIVIDKGATLVIQPGVRLLFESGAFIKIAEGGIMAMGTLANPIEFISAGASPSAGDYVNAVRFSAPTKVASIFEYCVVRHAQTAFDISFGAPEISHCFIADNSQSGIACRNDAAPKILYNTITRNLGTGAIECFGMSGPKINFNNIVDNAIGIQAFSSIFIDARHNWWGISPPDNSIIWGDNVNYTPWREVLEPKAFAP